MDNFLTTVFVIIGYFTGLCKSGSNCFYLHEDYYTINQRYCESGCCRDYGDDDEICCFTWTVGVILGICFACIAFIALVAFVVICCYMMKKRARNGHTITPMSSAPQQTNMVVYTAATGYSYPHPPSGFYPTSRFPGSSYGTAPPPYTAGTNPAYPPTYTQKQQSPSDPPLPDHLYGHFQTSAPSAPAGHNNPTNAPYGGYGTGQTG